MSEPSRRTELLLAAAIFLLALGMRAILPYDIVFRPGEPTVFMGADSYFHMRTVDNLLAHFPQRSGFDPYMIYPDGQNIPTGPFFDWLVAGTAWALGAGAPSEELVDRVGAWTPPVLAALTCLGLWLIGRRLIGAGAGLTAAAVAALLPGNFYELSRIGFPDHHIAESALFTALWGALAYSLAAAGAKARWGFAAAAGLTMGAFLLNRPAGAFVAAPIAVWGVWEAWRRLRSGRPVGEPAAIVAVVFALGAALFVPGGGMIWSELTLLALAGGAAAVLGSAAAAWLWQRRSWPRALFPAALAVCAAAGLGVAYFVVPESVQTLASTIERLSTERSTQTIRELLPLLLDPATSTYSLRPGFDHFGYAFLVFPFAATWLLYRALREDDPNLSLLAVVNVFFFGLALAQMRMSVYLAPTLALTVGAALWAMLRLDRGRVVRWTVLAAAALILARGAILQSKIAPVETGPNEDWRRTLAWLRENTPQPFGSDEAYFAYHPRLRAGERFVYPESVYSVMLWWDYGYWLERISRRIPTANGTQSGARFAARYFTETDPDAAAAMLAEAKSRYVVVDPAAPLWNREQLTPFNGKVRSMLLWGERTIGDYVAYYVRMRGGRPTIVTVFKPAYYRMMLTRLFAFGGEAHEPSRSSWVLSFEEHAGEDGPFRRISNAISFETYEDAQRYLELRPDQDLMLAGLNPMASPVPIEALDGYREVYRSNDNKLAGVSGRRPITVFEYPAPESAADGE